MVKKFETNSIEIQKQVNKNPSLRTAFDEMFTDWDDWDSKDDKVFMLLSDIFMNKKQDKLYHIFLEDNYIRVRCITTNNVWVNRYISANHLTDHITIKDFNTLMKKYGYEKASELFTPISLKTLERLILHQKNGIKI